MADAKLTALTAASALAAADLFYVSQSAASRKATGTQLLTLVGTTYVPLAGGTMTGALTIASGTLTGASAPGISITQTWNDAAVDFTAFKINATNTASSALALLMDVQLGGTTTMSLSRFGSLYVNGTVRSTTWAIGYYTAGQISVPTTGAYNFGMGSPDLYLWRDAAATLAQRNGTTQQIFRLYNTYTDASNYERLTLTGVAGTSVNITAETLGTGGDNIGIVLTPGGTGDITLGVSAVVGYNAVGPCVGMGYGGEYGVRVFSSARYGWTSGNLTGGIDTAMHRNAAGVVEVNNGTATAYRDLKLRNLLAGGGNGSYVQTPSMTVANLATAATAGAGARAFVTDANATTFLSTVAAGGANKVPVVSDGTNWLIG